MQFPAGHEEGPQDTGKTGGGKGSGRYIKRAAVKAAAATVAVTVLHRKRAAARQAIVTVTYAYTNK